MLEASRGPRGGPHRMFALPMPKCKNARAGAKSRGAAIHQMSLSAQWSFGGPSSAHAHSYTIHNPVQL